MAYHVHSLLIDFSNVNLDVKDKRSRTPVMLAAMKEHDEVQNYNNMDAVCML